MNFLPFNPPLNPNDCFLYKSASVGTTPSLFTFEKTKEKSELSPPPLRVADCVASVPVL
ncbi:hypothetical protein D3C87_2030760 [compost metagenome]